MAVFNFEVLTWPKFGVGWSISNVLLLYLLLFFSIQSGDLEAHNRTAVTPYRGRWHQNGQTGLKNTESKERFWVLNMLKWAPSSQEKLSGARQGILLPRIALASSSWVLFFTIMPTRVLSRSSSTVLWAELHSKNNSWALDCRRQP